MKSDIAADSREFRRGFIDLSSLKPGGKPRGARCIVWGCFQASHEPFV
jgi:hypothetical protein